MLFSDKITIYNHYVASNVDVWQRTLISGVDWRDSREYQLNGNSSIDDNSKAQITIPTTSKSSRNYIEWKAFNALNNSSKANYWTANPTSSKDIVVFGDTNKDITSSYSIDDLLAEFEKAGIITTVLDRTNKTYLKHRTLVIK